jgi:diaminohydroxyphosphoribosylaminopyrimidine deaminase / 5-amino-6-(5-phosphoribosylamino)uracil reductase
MATPSEIAAMRRALDLAVSPGVPAGPNPRVGCVLLDSAGRTVAQGFHRGAGSAHAEADALSSAGPRARGSTAVVTLEPCNHTGRTGPCSRALVAAGVARVVYGQPDSWPPAAGGADALRAAGVDVEGGVLAEEASAVNPAWSFAQTVGRPHVTWKAAVTLDGRSAAADGSSRWITSARSRADVHRLRSEVDAVVIGTGTVLRDDPRLTARVTEEDGTSLPADRQPLRVVLGLREVPAGSRVLDGSAPTLVLSTRDLPDALAQLYARGVRQALLEGGPTLAGAFVAGGLVDRVVVYVAPALLGAGPPALGAAGITTIGSALRLSTRDVTCFGPDVRITADNVRGGMG